MPRYQYTAKNEKGLVKKGILDATGEHDLAKSLREEGYVLVKSKIKKKQIEINLPSWLNFLDRVSLADKVMFVKNLKVMISSGIPLPRALKILSGQTKNKRFKSIIEKVAESITKGSTLSDAISDYGYVFEEVFSNMIAVGEESGTMEETLEILGNQMEKERELKSKIAGAMVYPAVIVSAMFLIGIVMLIVVVPELARLFDELGVELPLTTRLVIGLGVFLSVNWYVLPISLIAIIFLFRLFVKINWGKAVFDRAMLKIPVISGIVKKIYAARTIRTLSSLISAGVPIVRSLEIVAGGLSNVHYRKAVIETGEKVKTGKKIADALSVYSDLYPNLVIQMISIGEETGETSSILFKLADFYESEVTNATKNLSAIIEPVLMLLIGGVIGFFAISMIQPMYSLLDAI